MLGAVEVQQVTLAVRLHGDGQAVGQAVGVLGAIGGIRQTVGGVVEGLVHYASCHHGDESKLVMSVVVVLLKHTALHLLFNIAVYEVVTLLCMNCTGVL